jgi:hypothetical protein
MRENVSVTLLSSSTISTRAAGGLPETRDTQAIVGSPEGPVKAAIAVWSPKLTGLVSESCYILGRFLGDLG